MTAGGFDAPVFNVSWPTGEFGPIGLEGSVCLGFSKELQAQPEGLLRDALFAELVAKRKRNWLVRSFDATTQLQGSMGHAFVDAW